VRLERAPRDVQTSDPAALGQYQPIPAGGWGMKLTWKGVAFALAVLPAAVTGVFASVSVDYDHNADFRKYKTCAIAFAEGQPNLAKTSPLVHQTILENIKKHLVLRGLTKVDSDPDVTFTYHHSTQDETVLDTTGNGYGFGPGWGPGWGYAGGGWGAGTTQMMTFAEGSIIIDAYDTRSKLAIWRGVMTESIPKKAEKARKKIDKNINKMFEKWAAQHEKELEKAENPKD
jgi:hypothetical protein